MMASRGPADKAQNRESETEDAKPQTTASAATARHVKVEDGDADLDDDVPDPDEDDLDDLDDMLDDFSAANLEPRVAKPPAVGIPASRGSSSKAPASGDPFNLDDELNDEEFAKQLQEGMAGLLGELENSPEMQRQFEDMFKQMSETVAAEDPKETGSAPAPGSSSSSSSKSAAKPPNDPTTGEENSSFQETIRRTMERMQSSGDQATAAAAAGGGGDDFMADFIKQMAAGEFGGDGNEEDFSKMLMGMMEQLTNKEILYEPMKELHDKFPEWLTKNQDSTPAEDMKRYHEQQRIVAEIVAKFDEPSYSDSNAADREYIVDRMQKMQAAGSPPSDLVGDMASAQEALGSGDEQCNPQ